MSKNDALAALERFVVENDDLWELEAEIGRLNIFDALGIVHAEIRHSNFLAWLLDPAESHGQGQLFLSAVLMDLLRHVPASNRPLSPVDLDGTDLRGVQVRREWRHIDLLIVADEPRVVFAIENKVLSGEHSDQLRRYREAVASGFPEHRSLCVFLTREGDEPSDEAWQAYDYGRLYRALSRCVKRNEDSIGEEVRVFVGHYLAMLRSRFMDDPKIDELVDRIYRNHRQALDLIFERKSDPRSRIVQAFMQTVSEELPDLIVQGGMYDKKFIPSSLAGLVAGASDANRLYRDAQVHGQVWAGQLKSSARISYRRPDDEARHRQVLNAISKIEGLKVRVDSFSHGDRKQAILAIQIASAPNGLSDDDRTLKKAQEAARRIAGHLQQIEKTLRDPT